MTKGYRYLTPTCRIFLRYLTVNNKQFLFLFQLKTAYDQVVVPLELFRKKHIGGVKVRNYHQYIFYYIIYN